jgi:hypothetical protein
MHKIKDIVKMLVVAVWRSGSALKYLLVKCFYYKNRIKIIYYLYFTEIFTILFLIPALLSVIYILIDLMLVWMEPAYASSEDVGNLNNKISKYNNSEDKRELNNHYDNENNSDVSIYNERDHAIKILQLWESLDMENFINDFPLIHIENQIKFNYESIDIQEQCMTKINFLIKEGIITPFDLFRLMIEFGVDSKKGHITLENSERFLNFLDNISNDE